MKTFRIIWQEYPFTQTKERVVFVEAPDHGTAEDLARDHIERKYGVTRFAIHRNEEYTRPTGGRVLEG